MALCAEDTPKSNDVDVNRKDVIVIAVPTVGVTLEAGVGKKTMPVLALKSSFFGTIEKNFYSVRIAEFLYFQFFYVIPQRNQFSNLLLFSDEYRKFRYVRNGVL